MSLSRADTSLVGRWWWTVDRWTLAALAVLLVCGAILALAASPPVAERIGLERFYFARRQFLYLPVAGLVLLSVSLLDQRGIRRLALATFLVAWLLSLFVALFGTEIKGAQRWLLLPGMSLQPSEFMKPIFVVVAAWMFAEQHREGGLPGNAIAVGLFVAVVGTLLLQPDVGMGVVVAAVWFGQFFLAGLSLTWVGAMVLFGLVGSVGAYFVFPHVSSRVDRFLDPASGDNYQISKSLEAFRHGGALGTGPGEGTVKGVLPDAHSDFVFAVAGEEFGTIFCLLLVGLFAFVVLRGFSRLFQENDLFTMLAGSGLLAMFGLQALINMASTLHLMPTKGMTLPFLSYGGSSLLALAMTMGMVLALTRRRPAGDGPGRGAW
ncbi:MAG: putative peptidoglycan glycosyltransferase FtsW [Acetobacterales bacterium]